MGPAPSPGMLQQGAITACSKCFMSVSVFKRPFQPATCATCSALFDRGSVVQNLDVIRGSLCPGDMFAAHEVPLDAMMESLGPHRK